MYLVVDSVVDVLRFKAMDKVTHDIFLGMDFIEKWNIESRRKHKEWRIGELVRTISEWHTFNNQQNSRIEVYAECAGICELGNSCRKRLEDVVERVLREMEQVTGPTKIIEHEIRVKPGPKSVRLAYRRMSPAVEQFSRDKVHKMLKEDIIEPSKSDWCSRPVIVNKASGGKRFCVDYRDLDKVTEDACYPMTNLNPVLDKLRKAKFITKSI